jgi:hypothetical protein
MDTNTANGDGPRAGRVGSEGGAPFAPAWHTYIWAESVLNTHASQGAAFFVSKVVPGA